MTTSPDQDRTASLEAQDRGLRASDDDRASTVHVLQDAVVRGLLRPDEGSDRMAAAWAAVHLRDLAPLTADLPPARPLRMAPGWGVLLTLALEQLRATVRSARAGELPRARLVAALGIALLVVVLVGSLAGELFFDGGHEALEGH